MVPRSQAGGVQMMSMHAPPHRSSRNVQRLPSHTNALESAIYAIAALSTIGAWAFTCTRSNDVGPLGH